MIDLAGCGVIPAFVIPAFGRPRQDNYRESEATVRLYLRKPNEKRWVNIF